MDSDRSSIICNPFLQRYFLQNYQKRYDEDWKVRSNNGSNGKPISSNQSEKLKAQSIRSSQNLPQNLTMKANQTGTAICQHICKQVARRRWWQDREKSRENLRKRSPFWSRDIIVTKMLRIICEFCIARIHHLVKWTSIRLFYCYISLGRPTFKTYLQDKSKSCFKH